jgi:putative nucleotidyltransferase with HDIG domain
MSVESSRSRGAGLTREDVVRAVKALPPLPAVALRVMQVAQDPKSSASDLALVVSSDPGLSARVLRISNSAAYRRSREVTSVQEALVLLGFVQARNIAISTAITTAYAPDTLNALFRIDAFWRHSLAVAFKASDYAGRTRRLDVPSAFTAGVLHNMGRLAMFHADPAGVDQAIAEAMRTDRSIEEVEREMLGYDHAEIGGLLAQKWSLPGEICEAVTNHHHAAGSQPTLASVVAAADQFCVEHGLFPGFIVPGQPAGADEAPEFGHLLKQVDTLMDLVKGEPAGVRIAS